MSNRFITAQSFDLDSANSILLLGQTGSGKSYFVHEIIKKLEKRYNPEQLKYALFDLKQVEFEERSGNYKPEYLLFGVIKDTSVIAFARLEYLARMAENRVRMKEDQPRVFVYVEECDLAVTDQKRFDTALIKIMENAKAANMWLIYSTSRIDKQTVSKNLIKCADALLVGKLYDDGTKYLGIESTKNIKPYHFLVAKSSFA